MRGDQRTAMAAAALLALGVAVTTVFAGNGSVADKTEQATPPAPTPEVTILNKHEVEGILGREVRSAADENMGRIVDVLVDRAGQVRAAIIDFGGFLGVGSQQDRGRLGCAAFPAARQAGRPDRPRSQPRPGERCAGIPGRQARGRSGCPRQT